jgi:hypothetical protein
MKPQLEKLIMVGVLIHWVITSWGTNTLDANVFPTGQQLNISLN